MRYRELVENGLQTPFHLDFPDKQDAAIWLSVALLRNYLLEDYVNQADSRVEELNIDIGKKIEIFSAVAIFEGIKNQKLSLKFSDQRTPIEVPEGLTEYINLTNKTRVNKYCLYAQNKKTANANRNAISRLLEPDKPKELINPDILKSKVLVIAGRGNTGQFSNQLKEESIYGTALSEVFNIGENIIIKPDLEDFKFLTESENNDDIKYFEENFLRFKDEFLNAVPGEEAARRLISKVENSDYRNHDFLNLYSLVIDLVDNDKLRRIYEHYPGVKEKLPKHLKAVVINDIRQIKDYEGLIYGFLKRKIPVIVLSNRFIKDKKAIYFFEEYFSKRSDELRINWNKQKIKSLKRTGGNKRDYIDEELWQKCLRFLEQTIEIKTTTPHPADKLLIDLQRRISKLEGQERLKKAYWQTFNPLVYSFKNGSGWKPYHKALFDSFTNVFNVVKLTLDSKTRDLFENLVSSLKQDKDNYKKIPPRSNVFVQCIDINDQKKCFPNKGKSGITPKQINNDIKKIIFPGFPLDEPISRKLIDCISETLIKNIKLICWPKEGELTYNYILRRLKAGYFYDNVPNDWQISKDLLVRSNKDINDEIKTTLFVDIDEKAITEEYEEDEEALENISIFKYGTYTGTQKQDTEYIVKCNIIDLEGGSFMFLPKNGKVLAKIETEGDKFSFRKAKFKALSAGDEIFQYDLSSHKLRQVSKNVDGSHAIFNDLKIWRQSLYTSYEKCGKSIKKLSDCLKRINKQYKLNASPSPQNIRNWLYDEDMHGPEESNLRMILLAESDQEKIDKIPDILEGKSKARSLSLKVSSQIKKTIIKKLEEIDVANKNVIDIKVFGISLQIEFRKITKLRQTNVEVEYQNTHKFL
jgi:hypothetical protein